MHGEGIMGNDAIRDALDEAIKKADDLKREAGAALDKAIKAANRDKEKDPSLMDDPRYKTAKKMLNTYMREQNVKSTKLRSQAAYDKVGR
jgi:uncharacterized protein YggE